jgi:hypothetical protein
MKKGEAPRDGGSAGGKIPIAYSPSPIPYQYTSFLWIQMLCSRPRQAIVISKKDPP